MMRVAKRIWLVFGGAFVLLLMIGCELDQHAADSFAVGSSYHAAGDTLVCASTDALALAEHEQSLHRLVQFQAIELGCRIAPAGLPMTVVATGATLVQVEIGSNPFFGRFAGWTRAEGLAARH